MDDLKVLARQVNSDLSQFRAAAAFSVLAMEVDNGRPTQKVWDSIIDVVKCANALDDSAEKLAGRVLSEG